MSIIKRIEKAEQEVNPLPVDNRQLKRVIGANGDDHKFYIDGVEVSQSVYLKVESAQMAAAKERGEEIKINVSIIGMR